MKNILFIAGLCGPKFDYVLPRIGKYGNIYAYVPRKLTEERYYSLTQSAKEIIAGKLLTTTQLTQADLIQDINAMFNFLNSQLLKLYG